MTKTTDFASLTALAVSKEAVRKLVFSRPMKSEVQKISGRLCAHRGRRILQLEYSLPGNTVSQRNIPEGDVEREILSLLDEYKQANLLTPLGDAEWKVSKSGKEALLGAEALRRKLTGDTQSFERAIEALDKKKNYILSGNEDFLVKLGISDASGRVHDKRQGKFRQINRFLENIEDIYGELPAHDTIKVYDLCCGKSYLSFAVYYYLTEVKGREVSMLGIDLKRDVIAWCDGLARELNYSGMRFVCDNVTNTPKDEHPDLVISLHACDVATDIVLGAAVNLKAKVILSTPCCHKYLSDRISSESLSFVTEHAHLKRKICDALTDGLRAAKLKAEGYTVTALELTDPENTPKNTLLRAIRKEKQTPADSARELEQYSAALSFLLGEGANDYLKEFM